MPNMEKVYWDSCAWLGLLNRESDKFAELDYVWQKASSGELEIWTSTVAQLEVIKLASEKAALNVSGNFAKTEILTADNLDLIENIFDQPFVKRVSLDVEISTRARRLYRETAGLNKAPDAAHLVSAMKWNVPTLHTYDGTDLLHLNGKLQTDDGSNLTICQPTELPAKDLLTELENERSDDQRRNPTG